MPFLGCRVDALLRAGDAGAGASPWPWRRGVQWSALTAVLGWHRVPSCRLKKALRRRKLVAEEVDPGLCVEVPLVRGDPLCKAYVDGGVGLVSGRSCPEPAGNLGVEVRVEAVAGALLDGLDDFGGKDAWSCCVTLGEHEVLFDALADGIRNFAWFHEVGDRIRAVRRRWHDGDERDAEQERVVAAQSRVVEFRLGEQELYV